MTALDTRADDRAAEPWAEALDDFEQRLAGFRAVLDHDDQPMLGAWPPPSVAGRQIPPELASRARALLAEAGRLESEIQVRQNAVRLQLRPTSSPRHRPFTGRATRSTDL